MPLIWVLPSESGTEFLTATVTITIHLARGRLVADSDQRAGQFAVDRTLNHNRSIVVSAREPARIDAILWSTSAAPETGHG